MTIFYDPTPLRASTHHLRTIAQNRQSGMYRHQRSSTKQKGALWQAKLLCLDLLASSENFCLRQKGARRRSDRPKASRQSGAIGGRQGVIRHSVNTCNCGTNAPGLEIAQTAHSLVRGALQVPRGYDSTQSCTSRTGRVRYRLPNRTQTAHHLRPVQRIYGSIGHGYITSCISHPIV
jgi:hypothetical protein